MNMKLVIVESPAKAKTINKYLGKDYEVIASFGHVRDLSSKDGSVDVNDGFRMLWQVDAKGEKHLQDIIKKAQNADEIYLASDPDREGEAIAWHIIEELKRRKKLKVPFKRIVFNEITKTCVLNALKNPREIDMNLVDAYLARRALDYLVGFSLSPVLWRKLPGSKSAGRVQSVALRLICDREKEIEAFKEQEYWTLEGDFATLKKENFAATLTHWQGKKLGKFDVADQAAAERIKTALQKDSFTVQSVEKKQVKRSPAPAFTTSTLQQEASRKLDFSAKKTMRTAQELYEGVDIGGETVGLITYMRTDGVALSQEAISAMRSFISKTYGNSFIPEQPRYYKNNIKNAQEAHEAIRPTSVLRTPESLKNSLSRDHFRLYELIWKRAVASQMSNAVLDKVAADIQAPQTQSILHATGQTVAFPGFLKLYRPQADDEEETQEQALPPLSVGATLTCQAIKAEQHMTEPPPRYSEASLVKKMEELGIGRPSTYASILSVIQDRKYATLQKKRFVPEERGRLVTAFLESFFEKYIQYDFTAQLETQLDDITAGSLPYQKVLKEFWTEFDPAIKQTEKERTTLILDKISHLLEQHLFPNEQAKQCPHCKKGTLSLKVGRFGAFLGCSNYPQCNYTRPLVTESAETMTEASSSDVLKKGPDGWYVQKDNKKVAVPKGITAESLTPDQIQFLLSLPKTLGTDPKTQQPVELGIGRYGPYVKQGSNFTSIKPVSALWGMDLDKALSLAQPKAKATSLGDYEGQPVMLQDGRYGLYIKFGKQNIALPTAWKKNPSSITLENAIQLIQKGPKKVKK